MRYLPKSPAERRSRCFRQIGAGSTIDDLFSTIPAGVPPAERDLERSPRQMAESEIIDHFKAAAAETANGYTSFLGAGAYRHYAAPSLSIRWCSAGGVYSLPTLLPGGDYPQGTLQAIFEFQTMICELTGMEIANASMYDGSTGAAESVTMAVRITRRSGVLVARTVHPEYREVMQTYAQHQAMPATVLAYGDDGRLDLAALERSVSEETACVLVQSPNFFGVVEDIFPRSPRSRTARARC